MLPQRTRIEKYRIEAETIAPLHVGTGNGDMNEVLVHPATDRPFIQASSIAGVLRAVSEQINDSKTTENLFGTSREGKKGSTVLTESRLKISDGLFDLSSVKMEVRPRLAIDPASGTVAAGQLAGSGRSAGHKFETEFIGTGAKFTFYIYLNHEPDDSNKEAFENILGEIKYGRVQFGGQKTNGAGFIKLNALKHASFDMSNEEGRKAWGLEHLMDVQNTGDKGLPPHYKDLLEDLEKSGKSKIAYRITVEGSTDGPLLVKGIAVEGFGPDAPDSENIKNAAGEYIIPGSSLKGALRNRITWLSKLMKKESLAVRCFGKSGKRDSRGEKGCVLVHDVIVGGDKKMVNTILQHRIHIDKFTGGVMQQALLSEKTISGNLMMQIDVENSFARKEAAGMLILALRDLAIGAFNLGSGFSIGHGFINVESIRIEDTLSGKLALINMNSQETNDGERLIQDCLTAVEAWEEQ